MLGLLFFIARVKILLLRRELTYGRGGEGQVCMLKCQELHWEIDELMY